ncbi:MFS transporter [Actinokineospora guangxiensis]|uniref:MFS transporter n=1 Tax=Actinokineospora guangxiensis TaxID=1490288 RepID=A0ABW0ENC2_9PSEU
MTSAPLSRNRNYRLLWTGQALAELGIGASAVALPLLVLAVTGSAAASGLVLGVYAAAQLAAAAPAGVLVDRWDLRRVLIGCEAVQAAAIGAVAAAVWAGVATLPVLLALAVVLGTTRALFEPAEAAALPALVRPDQVSTAVAMNAARGSIGSLGGNALGGALFSLRHWAPFGMQAAAHAVSTVLLLFLRVPARAPTARAGFRHELTEGLRWLWRNRAMRAVTACAAGLNLHFQAFYLVVLAVVVQNGAPAAHVGLMASMFGVGGILGALAAPRLCRLLPTRTAILAAMWAIAALMPFAAVLGNAFAIGGVLAGAAFLTPTASTAITTYQLLHTPEHLRGRMAAAVSTAVGTAAVAGPAVGGVLADLTPPATAILLCAVGTALCATAATLAPSLRTLPAPHQAEPAPTH